MVLKPCATHPKQPMVLLYIVLESLANSFKTMYGRDVMFFPNKLKDNKKCYVLVINSIKH